MRLFQIGDCVVFKHDGARGIVLTIKEDVCHVLWEDYFASWENVDLLTVDEQLNRTQRLIKA